MNAYVLIGILGSVASIISVAIAAPTAKSKLVHGIYGFVLAGLVGGAVLHNQLEQRRVREAELRAENALAEVARLQDVQKQARMLLDSRGYFSTSDEGSNRGFILAAFSFLETQRSSFPETYQIAKTLVVEGLKIAESAGRVGSEGYYDERKRLEDGAATMRELLKGIAGGKGT